MSIAIVLGTRPEIIKMSPIIIECEKRGLNYFILHTGQHYSHEMDGVFFKQLELPEPKYNLSVGSGSHAEQTGKIMAGVERILKEESPDIILVQGDTNTVLAGALSAAKLHIKVGHVEAGLRSFDRSMPEEINRVVVDHISEYLFAPTEKAKQNLFNEGVTEGKIFITGNTVVDSVYRYMQISKRKYKVLEKLGFKPKEYFMITTHREENVDNKNRLLEILNGLEKLSEEFGLPVIFPVHPRALKNIRMFKLNLDGVRAISPVGFLEFLQLEANSKVILTDSGGVQEEACILGVPCVTLRDSTERPETLEAGSNVLVGTNAKEILKGVRLMIDRENGWKNPFGDGKAGERIVRQLLS